MGTGSPRTIVYRRDSDETRAGPEGMSNRVGTVRFRNV
ncbi:hypothetical protein C485_07682 [Natrinema altunense JCM 12890]|uniref:Uncharacterized protein n=1 Tax=Natrinema altunense (strain JCM 12890 / CGMCC 1.3731 / AJ2) TaxID=1227494 RepID=L9ZL56_NATA2|nr:hypothetical protein C485_07682 [Natrinema altunense JCM 12890]